MASRTAVASRRAPLSKDRVVRAATALADKSGIETLTMRNLAQDLGVEAMSLYHYVPNKGAILSGIADIVASEIEVPSSGTNWKAAVRKSAVSFHDALARHPWASSLMMSGGVGPARMRYMESLLGRLREAGFSPQMTHHAYHALDSHIFGFTIWAAGYAKAITANPGAIQAFLKQVPADRYPYFLEHAAVHMTRSGRDGVSEFEFGLDLILEGLERLRGTVSRGSSSERKTGRSRGGRTRLRTPVLGRISG